MQPRKRRRLLLWVVFYSALLISNATASAQTMRDFVQQAARHADWVDQRIREQIANVASPDIHTLLSQTNFHVDTVTVFPTAYAERLRGGTKRIHISAQLVLAFYYQAELGLINIATGNSQEQCSLAYSSYLRISARKMMEDAFAGRRPYPIHPPEEYAKEYGGQCHNLETLYPFAEHLKQSRFNAVSAAIATVYLHELAHHVYRDVSDFRSPLDLSDPRSMRLYLRLMCYSQQKELRADKWAARMLVELGWGANIFDVTMWSTLTSLGDIDPDIERGATHPSPWRRHGIFMDAGRTYLRAKGIEIREDLSELVDRALRHQQKIELLLPVTPIPGTDDVVCR